MRSNSNDESTESVNAMVLVVGESGRRFSQISSFSTYRMYRVKCESLGFSKLKSRSPPKLNQTCLYSVLSTLPLIQGSSAPKKKKKKIPGGEALKVLA